MIILNKYEQFIPIKGYEDKYLISTFARIYDINENRFIIPIHKHHELNIYIVEIGKYLDEIMLESFNPICNSDEYYPYHIDGIIFNNMIWNLEWKKGKRNYQVNKDSNTGANCRRSTITSDIVKSICFDLQSEQYKLRDIANKYNVSKDLVFSIKRRQCWKNISKDYNWHGSGHLE